MFAFSSLFSPQFVAASFDAAIERDAANGRVNAQFALSLANAYGLELPSSPGQAVKFINELLGLAKAPKLASGPGARAHAPAVAQALHALAQALHSAGKVKGLPNLVSLPDWADPQKLAAAKKAAAEKRAAKKARKVAAEERAAKKAAAGAIVAPPAATAAAHDEHDEHDEHVHNIHEHVEHVLQAIKNGTLPEGDVVALRAALGVTQIA